MKKEKKHKDLKNKPIGRPKITIDWAGVDKLLIAGCSGVEVCDYFGFHPETFYKRCEIDKEMLFSDYIQSKRQKGNAILRAKQYETAINGNVTMQIFLGKNRLEQADAQKVEHSGELAQPVTITLTAEAIDRAKQLIDNDY